MQSELIYDFLNSISKVRTKNQGSFYNVYFQIVIKWQELIRWEMNFQKELFSLMKMKRKENIAYIEQKLDLFNLIIYRIQDKTESRSKNDA